MGNLGAIQARMKSIRQTVQIAGAQKLISASRIGKARRMLEDTKPFHTQIRQRIAYLLALAPEVSSPFLEKGEANYAKRGLLVFTSNTGLAGGYNSNVIKLAEAFLNEYPVSRTIVLGRVGRVRFADRLDSADDIFTMGPPSMFVARELTEHITKLFHDDVVDAFDIVYTKYHSAVKLTPTVERIFPLHPSSFGEPVSLLPVMEFEPSADAVMSALSVSSLKGFLYGCLVHAYVSELSSRVMAMDSAIRNGNEMLDKLSLLYNRARQAAITQEITEIVAGASAMADAN